MTVPEHVLHTARLYLRLFTPGDGEAVSAIFADTEAKQFYPEMNRLDMAEKWVAKNLERYATDGIGLWAACLNETDELVGDCGLAYQDVEGSRELEVAYHLRADHRGRGLATEGALACRDHAFETLDCKRVVSMVHPDNHASKGVAQRVHTRTRRFRRLGDDYFLFFTPREDWIMRRESQ
ncbi:MAG: GNAT family N-acetyltransferase [Gemmatimonadales bacterium]